MAAIFLIIVSTNLQNNFHTFKINSSEILFHSILKEVFTKPIFG